MAKNRLKLDFSLETAEERLQFINTYIVQFTDLTAKESETIADYLLWGKDRNNVPIGIETELKTRWNQTNPVASLDEVLENPALSRTQLIDLPNAVQWRKPRNVFSREEARKEAPPELQETFENLWRQIDTLDLQIGFYEELIGKRNEPPRIDLMRRFSEEDLINAQHAARQLDQKTYLDLRGRLIELRQQQYIIRDSYRSTLCTTTSGSTPTFNPTLNFETDIEVLPLGLRAGPVGQLVFHPKFNPFKLNENNLKLISDLIWKKKQVNTPHVFDFRNLEALYQLYLYKEEIEEQIQKDKELHQFESNQEQLLETLNFYESIAGLTPIQLEILRFKEQKVKNADIVFIVNKKYNKNYTANYISTIFRQKTLSKIVEAVKLHQDTIESCFFPENFQRCRDCGKILLLDPRNWTRRARSPSGFQSRCKQCEKKKRQGG